MATKPHSNVRLCQLISQQWQYRTKYFFLNNLQGLFKLVRFLHGPLDFTVPDEFSHYQESIKQEADGIFVSEWKLSRSMTTASRLLQDTDYTFKGFVVVCPRHIAEDLIRLVNIPPLKCLFYHVGDISR